MARQRWSWPNVHTCEFRLTLYKINNVDIKLSTTVTPSSSSPYRPQKNPTARAISAPTLRHCAKVRTYHSSTHANIRIQTHAATTILPPPRHPHRAARYAQHTTTSNNAHDTPKATRPCMNMAYTNHGQWPTADEWGAYTH